MKNLSTYLNAKKNSMSYRMILTYNFSDDDTRSSFAELVEELGFVEAEDQSTYALPLAIQKKSKDVVDTIVKWSADKSIRISEDDFVQLFYLAFVTIEGENEFKLASKFLKYNPKTKGLI